MVQPFVSASALVSSWGCVSSCVGPDVRRSPSMTVCERERERERQTERERERDTKFKILKSQRPGIFNIENHCRADY